MEEHIKEISKEIYDEAMEKYHGHIAREIEDKVFTVAQIWGYGIYYTKVYEENGKYYVLYHIGSTCD